MDSLPDILVGSPQHEAVIEDAAKLVEQHVARRGGLRGITLKTGLGMVRAARPDILTRAVRRLLPEFAEALDPLYQEFRGAGGSDFGAYVQRHGARASSALLAVTDTRVGQASSLVQAAYARLRALAESELETALPALAALLGRHVAGK